MKSESILQLPMRTTASIFGLLLIVTGIASLFYPRKGSGFARFGKSRLTAWLTWSPTPRFTLDEDAAEGYAKVGKPSGKPYIVPMCGMDNYVLPPKYLSCLKNETRRELSLAQSFNDLMNMEATVGDAGKHDELEIEVVGKFLNPNLTRLTPTMVSQINDVMSVVIGDAQEWKDFNVAELSTLLVHRLVHRMLVGDALCKNDAYIRACQSYTMSFLMNGFAWNWRPVWPFANAIYWLSAWPHRRDLQRAVAFLVPVIRERKEKLESSAMPTTSDNHKQQKPLDMIQWLLEMPVANPEDGEPERHAERILHLTFAASTVSGALISHIIHQVLMCPQYSEELRREIDDCLQQYGGWTEKAIANMHFMDSYVREMLRLTPPSVLTCHRTVMEDEHKFGDDLILPKGTRICFPTQPIHLDPENYDDPLRFDPYRFIRKEGEGAHETLGAAQINSKYLAFGYGRQACPGRFFAVRQIKLIFSKLLHNYDLKWPETSSERPTRLVVEGAFFPNMGTRVALRQRKSQVRQA